MKFSIKDVFSKCDKIRRKLRIWSHLLKKFLMENLIFCAVHFRYMRSSGENIRLSSLMVVQRLFQTEFYSVIYLVFNMRNIPYKGVGNKSEPQGNGL